MPSDAVGWNVVLFLALMVAIAVALLAGAASLSEVRRRPADRAHRGRVVLRDVRAFLEGVIRWKADGSGASGADTKS